MNSDPESLHESDDLKSPGVHDRICSEDDWDCYSKLSWTGYVTNSMLRLLSGDFSSLNNDLVVSVIFLGLCMVSWHCIQFMMQRFSSGKCPYQTTRRFQFPPRHSATYSNNGGHQLADDNEVFEQPLDSDEHREADVRAAGDSWEQDEYDPDYDANNEIMVMLLQDTPDDSDDTNTPLRSDNDEDALLQDLVMNRPEDETQIVDVDTPSNMASAMTGNQMNDRSRGGKSIDTNNRNNVN